jgi:hypothetical protein
MIRVLKAMVDTMLVDVENQDVRADNDLRAIVFVNWKDFGFVNQSSQVR